MNWYILCNIVLSIIIGTGKTYTGIKLVYLFNKINLQWQELGNEKKQIIFCGPSNKSVDLVASKFVFLMVTFFFI